jgi:hypothetical protein
MPTSRSWIGILRDVKAYLQSENADKDAEDHFLLSEPGVILFLGIVADDNETIVPEETMYFVDGKPKSLMEGLSKSGSGATPTIIY